MAQGVLNQFINWGAKSWLGQLGLCCETESPPPGPEGAHLCTAMEFLLCSPNLLCGILLYAHTICISPGLPFQDFPLLNLPVYSPGCTFPQHLFQLLLHLVMCNFYKGAGSLISWGEGTRGTCFMSLWVVCSLSKSSRADDRRPRRE